MVVGSGAEGRGGGGEGIAAVFWPPLADAINRFEPAAGPECESDVMVSEGKQARHTQIRNPHLL